MESPSWMRNQMSLHSLLKQWWKKGPFPLSWSQECFQIEQGKKMPECLNTSGRVSFRSQLGVKTQQFTLIYSASAFEAPEATPKVWMPCGLTPQICRIWQQDLSETFLRCLEDTFHQRVRKYPTIPTPKAIKQLYQNDLKIPNHKRDMTKRCCIR